MGKLSKNLKTTLKNTMNLTKHNKKIIVNLAINYGSKNEILKAAKKVRNKNIKSFEKVYIQKVCQTQIFLIRTGGHQRLSNFMLWQLAYAELFFSKKIMARF